MPGRPRVAVTRAAHQTAELRHALEERGAVPVLLPLLAIAAPEDDVALETALAGLERFDFVLFCSVNAARALLDHLHDPGVALRRARVAAVGAKTAAYVRDRGVRVDLVPAREDAAGLLDALKNETAARGSRMLLPRGDRADARLVAGLEEFCAAVEAPIAYVTGSAGRAAAARLEEAVARGSLDALTFASGSAIDVVFEELGETAARACLTAVPIAVLGPSTATVLARRGLRADAVAAQRTMAALADAALVCARPGSVPPGSDDKEDP